MDLTRYIGRKKTSRTRSDASRVTKRSLSDLYTFPETHRSHVWRPRLGSVTPHPRPLTDKTGTESSSPRPSVNLRKSLGPFYPRDNGYGHCNCGWNGKEENQRERNEGGRTKDPKEGLSSESETLASWIRFVEEPTWTGVEKSPSLLEDPTL